MADHTSITATVNLATKKVKFSGVVGLREVVDVQLVAASTFPGVYSDWSLELVKNGVAVAECTTFSAAGLGELDLSGAAMTALFADKGPTARIRFLFRLWDETADALIAQDWLYVVNNEAPAEEDTTPMGELVAAEAIAAGQVVRINSDGKAAKSSNISYEYVRATVGVASLSAAVGELVPIVNRGPISNDAWNWTPGAAVFLSEDGNLSHSAPAAWSECRVGVAQSANTIWLTMWPGANGQPGQRGTTGPTGPTGATGATGAQGEQGAEGPAGDDGATWLSDSVDPGDETGSDGDFYLNTASAKVFKKAGGAWSQIATLAIETDVVAAYVLDLVAASFSSISTLTDPTVDDMVSAINATITKLKGL